MELLIWAGGRWRRVCASTGRVEGWRRRARFVCSRRGALRELSAHAALRSIVKGPRLPKERYGQNVTHVPAMRKDASIQTDTESINTDACNPVQNLLKLASQENKNNQVLTSQEKKDQVSTSQENKNNQVSTSQENKENQVSRTPQKRPRSASTEVLEARPLKQQKVVVEAKNKLKDHQYESKRKLDKKKIISNHHIVSDTESTNDPLNPGDTQKAVDHTTDSITNDEDKGKEKSTHKAKKIIQSVNDKMKQLLRKDSSESEIVFEEDRFKEVIVEAKNKIKDHQSKRKLEKKKGKPQKNDILFKAVDHTTDSITSNDEDKGKEKSTHKAKKNIRSVNDKEMKQLLRKDSSESEIEIEEGQFKELIIHEEDVLLLRQYIETHNTNIDLLKYDEDDNYKTMIFFKINPLVRLERCPRIARMLKNRDANITIHFARQLGLKTVTESDENEKNKPKRTKYRYAKAVAMSRSTIDSDYTPVKKKNNASISSSDDSQSEYERKTKKNRSRQKQSSKFQAKRKNSSSDTESDTHTDSNVSEDKKTMSNKKDYSSSDDESNKLKKTTKGKTKSVLISDKENITRNIESKNNKERINDKKNSKTTEREDILVKRTYKTRNSTDNIKKKLTKENADSTNQDKEMSIKNAFIVYCTSQYKTSTQTKNKGSDVNFNNSNDVNGANKKNKNKIKNSAVENPKPKQNMKPALKRRIVAPKRSSVPPGREYSMLEDQAIVAWLSTSTQRERAVNGNRVWRELQDCYSNLTGQKRSWHSLRNRYLRYILPSLGSLAIPSAQAQRLRANATLGELKSRTKPRRNSVFNLPVVRSASARRPRPLPSPDKRPTKPTESQRSNSPEIEEIPSPKQRVLRSRSQLSQSQNENLPNKQSNKQTPTLRTSPRKSPIKSASVNSPTKSSRLSSPTYSELTRRFLRNRSTPQPTPEPATVHLHHKRRLYNPQRPTSSGSPATSQ